MDAARVCGVTNCGRPVRWVISLNLQHTGPIDEPEVMGNALPIDLCGDHAMELKAGLPAGIVKDEQRVIPD